MRLLEGSYTRETYPEGDWGDGFWEDSTGAYMCGETLRDLFEIPDEVETLWISLHDRSAKNRYRSIVEYDADIPTVMLDDVNVDYSDPDVDDLLESLIGRTVYVQVEYE